MIRPVNNDDDDEYITRKDINMLKLKEMNKA